MNSYQRNGKALKFGSFVVSGWHLLSSGQLGNSSSQGSISIVFTLVLGFSLQIWVFLRPIDFVLVEHLVRKEDCSYKGQSKDLDGVIKFGSVQICK